MNISKLPLSLLARHPVRNLSAAAHHQHKNQKYAKLKVPSTACHLDLTKGQISYRKTKKVVVRASEWTMTLERQWLTTQVEKLFNEHSTIIVFHRINKRGSWALADNLRAQGLEAHCPRYPNPCYTKYLRVSKYIRLLPLFQDLTGVVATTKPEEAHLICKAIDKDKDFLLLGGMIDGVLQGPNTLKYLANLDDIDAARLELVSLLSQPDRDLVSTLSTTPAMLTAVLDKRGTTV